MSRSESLMNRGFIKRNEKLISVSLIAAVILIWAAVLFTDYNSPAPGKYHSLESYEGCHIEYGPSECIDGNLVTSFYNPGTEALTSVSMNFRDGEDVDIYNCNETLESESAGTLTTVPCTEDMDTEKVWLVWCCGDECSDTYMTNISADLALIY